MLLDSTVVFNELMYHPADDGIGEWIEFHNQMATNLDLSGWTIRGGVDFSFPEDTIIPGFGYLVVAEDPAALASQGGYDDALGPLVGQLSNGGERVELVNNNGRVMNEIDYDDQGRWPVGPDGSGATLAKRNPNAGSEAPENWTTSFNMGGTPGASNFSDQLPNLTFNETAGGNDAEFWIEIVNNGDQDLGLEGFAIQIVGATDRAYVFPSTTLGAGEFTQIVQDTLGFSANPGDRLFLLTPDAQNVLDAVVVGDTLLGRSPDGTGDMLFPASPTPGAANNFQFHDEIVINEIMYHHRPELGGEGQPFLKNAEEWIELYNQSDHSVELTGWELVDGIEYAFAPGTMLDAGQYLVVAKDAAALKAKYPAIADRIAGNYSGRLNNESDRIELVDAAGNPADEVHYYQDGRWPKSADGRGSSLELRDAGADNAIAEAWAASIEDDDSTWETYSYRGTAAASAVGPDGRWNEFVLGLLGWGEVLLDDISVIESPDSGAPIQLIQNGSFENDTVGGAAVPLQVRSSVGDWRIIGNHRHSEVIVDPTDDANQVLRLVATGPTEHMHNHAETTFANGLRVTNGREYEISFKAKWITGSNQLNTRLYFNRLAATTLIAQSEFHGTPAAQNSVFEANVGPTYTDFGHSPAVPQPGQAIDVSVLPADPEGLNAVTLWWALDGNAWQSTDMTPDADGKYHGTIPGQGFGDVVQIYVQAQDALGATSTYPSKGSDSRALIKIDDNLAVMDNVHNVRIIMTTDDADFLHEITNVMSNDTMRATVVYDETEVFYDVGVRLRASERHRACACNVSFTIRFDPDHLFRDVHETVVVDRSGSGGDQDVYEAIIEPAFHHAGGIPDMYSDIIHVNTPKDQHNAFAMLKMARYEDDFLDSQFENGSDGQRYKMELIYYPTTATVDGLKLPQPDGVIGTDFRDLGDDKEAYRWNFILKNNRMADDFSPLIEFAKTMDLSGAALEAAVPLVMDIDQWMRASAMVSLTGSWDQYILGPNSLHNMMVYVRPRDNRILMLPWDMDTAFKRSATQPLTFSPGNIPTKNLQKILDIPAYERLLFGHFQDIIATTYNTDYMAQWTEHFGQLGRRNYSSILSYIGTRVNYITSQLPAEVPFRITTNSGDDFTTGEVAETIRGEGWINVREIRLAGSDQPLLVEWTNLDSWQATVPLRLGDNPLIFEAYDFQGALIASDSIGIESTAGKTRVADALRITELMFNPAQPTTAELAIDPLFDNDDFEFIELKNISGETIDLTGVRFNDGVDFDFADSSVTSLAPGAFVVVVQNTGAFLSRYSEFDQSLIAGEFAPNHLRNSGERITLLDQFGQAIHNFRYRDGWYDGIDGAGFSLTVRDATADVSLWDTSEGWRPSSLIGGSPGADDSLTTPDPGSIVINEILTHSDAAGGDWVELHNTTDRAIDVGGWLLSDDELVLDKFQIAPGTSIARGGFLLLSEDDHFGNADHPGTSVPFGFSELGERIIVTAALPDGTPLGYREDKTFGAAENGVTFGRHVKSTGGSDFTALATPTPEADNSLPLVGPIVIHEIFYHPTDDREEFIELKNISDAVVSLSDSAAPTHTWRFTNGVTFTFPAGVSVAPDETILVVPDDPVVFRAANGVPEAIAIFGPYLGSLNNGGESLELSKPGPAEPDGTVPLILVDRVNYDNLPPWPMEAAGAGAALQRRVVDAYGNDPANWAASGDGGTPGIVPPQVTGVFVSGSEWTAEFFDHLAATGLGEAGFAIPTGMRQFDALSWIGIDQVSIRFSRDMTVTQADLTLWGVNTRQHGIADFAYDNANFVATWTLGNPLRAEALLLDLSSEVHDVGGRHLDADWVDGSSTFPSGNDFVEGNERFRFRLNVLPGDVDADATVDRTDLIDIIHHLGSGAGNSEFDPRHDLNGDARSDVHDLRAALLRMGSGLPSGEAQPGTAAPHAAVDAVFSRAGGASPGRLLLADSLEEFIASDKSMRAQRKRIDSRPSSLDRSIDTIDRLGRRDRSTLRRADRHNNLSTTRDTPLRRLQATAVDHAVAEHSASDRVNAFMRRAVNGVRH